MTSGDLCSGSSSPSLGLSPLNTSLSYFPVFPALYVAAVNPSTSTATALRPESGLGGVEWCGGGSEGQTGQALNVKANSRSNKSDLIIIFLCVAVRAWLRLTRAGEPGQTPVKGAFIVPLKTLFGERKEGKEKKNNGSENFRGPSAGIILRGSR